MPIQTLRILFLLSIFLIALLQIHLFEIAFAKLGLTPEITLFLLIGALLGSGINVPLYSLQRQGAEFDQLPDPNKQLWELFPQIEHNKIIVAVNIGGCLIPVGLSLYFLSLQLISPLKIIIGIAAITALSFKFSRIIPGLGVGMPIYLAPIASAAIALLLDSEHAAQLAYISGVFGVLIGADILRINSISGLQTPVASIGGAGTFDGIFITGLIAALLA